MRTIRAVFRMTAFVLGTLAIYYYWFFTQPVRRDPAEARRHTFLRWSRFFKWVAGMRLVVNGTPPPPPFFLVSNHLSYTDIAVLRLAAEGVFVAKQDIESWPVAGKIIANMGTVFIDRENRRDIPRAGELIDARLDSGDGVIIFPEGTSTRGEEVLPFNSSFFEYAARRNIAVYYAAVSYSTPPGELPADTVCWWDDISFFAHMFRLFSVKSWTATVTFGSEPITNTDRKLLARELHERVTEAFTPVE
ncbi:MAG: 1-acyl-sn-glycerol-3-phosphate acyltransferase [Acidobacteria bacterium]|nr:1-acyl-sn-glycerol-3-phosphate acyltransferase [Acidobacteriota bacterium]